MNRTNIEYLSHCWNFITGCDNWRDPNICPMGDTCWAKKMAYRFHHSFERTFHGDIFFQRFPRTASRIGVCFTGEIFGSDIAWWASLLRRMREHPAFLFYLLTKRPESIPRHGWPVNAWVGVSVWNQPSFDRAIPYLHRIEANRWLSVEPMYGPIVSDPLIHIDWLVLGGQTNPLKLPEKQWIRDLEAAIAIPTWEKNNLKPLLGKLRQEFPR